jgi:hypothetical protein
MDGIQRARTFLKRLCTYPTIAPYPQTTDFRESGLLADAKQPIRVGTEKLLIDAHDGPGFE